MLNKFHVIDTPCRPCRWKVENKQWPGTNNSWTEYFEDVTDANTEADRRNRLYFDTTRSEVTPKEI